MPNSPRTLKARLVFPVAAPPIPNGCVTIHEGRIVKVGANSDAADIEDLGNVALLPGLVNAHTHLEFSHLREPLGHEGIPFGDWVRLAIESRGQDSREASAAIRTGLRESRRSGVTLLGEIAQPDWSPDAFKEAGTDVTVFQELIAPTAERVSMAIDLAQSHLDKFPTSNPRPGLSPHAPYSVRSDLLEAAVSLSKTKRIPLAFHLAESREEIEFLRAGSGPMRDFLERINAWDPTVFRPDTRPLDFLHTLSDAHRALVIHGNYLDREEIAFLAGRADRMSVVYCPRTHAWFDHAAYPLEKLLAAGVTLALGTDSRASSPDLSILAEMRFLTKQYPGVSPRTVLELGTLGGAKALGRDDELGTIQSDRPANLTAVELPDRRPSDPHESLFDSECPVVASWHQGNRTCL